MILCFGKIMLFVLFIIAVKSAVCDINNTEGTNEFRSDYTYYPSVGYWFKANPVPVDFQTARLLCHYEGAELASPLTPEILEVIKEIVANHEPKLKVYFSGVHQTFGNGVYTSIEGIPLEKLAINNWDDGEPNGFQNQQCLVYSNDGKIWDYNCPEPYPFICYRKYSASDKLTECGTIDKAYKLDPETGHCYKFHKHADIWERALKICHAEGGYLAVINSQAEAANLNALVKRSPLPMYTVYDRTVALGFREWGQVNTWWTVQGQVLEEAGYEDWCNGCPDGSKIDDNRQSCGGLINGKLDDIWCNIPYAFICEKTTDSLANTTIIDEIHFRDKKNNQS